MILGPMDLRFEAAAIRAETGVAHVPGTFGVVPVVAPFPVPAGVAVGLPAGVTMGVPGVLAGEEWVVSSVDDTALLPRYGDNIDLSPQVPLSVGTQASTFWQVGEWCRSSASLPRPSQIS